jgi:polysaccharide deacetylase 2 family uncharacterized protein YibQ
LDAFARRLSEAGFVRIEDAGSPVRSESLQRQKVSVFRQTYRVPRRHESTDLSSLLNPVANPLGSNLVLTLTQKKGPVSNAVFTFTASFGEAVEVVFEKSDLPKVCLIIDDAGYQKGESLESLYGFKVPVTLSIIPGAEFSKVLAEEVPGHGVEVMCHMPMEGHEKVEAGAYKEFIKVGMSPLEAKRLVVEALDSLPGCKGLNNHMGSRATTDVELMDGVCGALKERGLYFIDSKTSAGSVAWEEAEKAHLLLSARDVFLDDVVEPGLILKQLNVLVRKAKKRGWAVGIGHFKLTTLQTLEKAFRQLKGVQFVYASEVVKE